MIRRATIVCVLLSVAASGGLFSLPGLDLSPLQGEQTGGETEGRCPEKHWSLPPFLSLNEPLWHETQRVSALPRPFWVHFRDEDSDATGVDSLWPLAVHRRRPWRHHTRLLLAYATIQDPRWYDRKEYRWGLIPLVWGGRVPAKGAYFALFPVGGWLHDIGGYDHIRFALFPLYLNTVRADRHQHSVLWPVFSITRQAGELRKWRVFPFAGGAHSGNRNHYFALWPLLHAVREETDGHIRRGHAFLPFYGHLTETAKETGEQTFWSRTVLWPFFSGASGHGIRRLHLAWPLYQYKTVHEDGDLAYRKQYFWPFHGTRERPGDRYRFIAWPIYHRWILEPNGETTRENRYVLPFYWSSVVRRQGRITQFRQMFWPLLRRERYGEHARTTALALWPYRNATPIHRNYAPFWTVYSHTEDADGYEQQILWGLWRYRESNLDSDKGSAQRDIARAHFRIPLLLNAHRTGDTYSVSLLKGLLTVTNADADTQNRLFWLLRW